MQLSFRPQAFRVKSHISVLLLENMQGLYGHMSFSLKNKARKTVGAIAVTPHVAVPSHSWGSPRATSPDSRMLLLLPACPAQMHRRLWLED